MLYLVAKKEVNIVVMDGLLFIGHFSHTLSGILGHVNYRLNTEDLNSRTKYDWKMASGYVKNVPQAGKVWRIKN